MFYHIEKLLCVNGDEFFKRDRSDVPEVRDWFLSHIYRYNYCKGVIYELKKYAHLMSEDDEKMETPPFESINEEDQNETKEEDTNNG